MATLEAGRVRTVGLALALTAVWIGAAACAKQEQAPGDDASRSAAAEAANTPTTASLKVAPPPDPEACFHYDGSEYVCPADGAKDAAQRGTLLASGTEILEGSIRIKTAQGEKTINLPTGKKLDAIFLTSRGLRLLEDHYRYDQPNKPEHKQRADSIKKFIESIKE